jgi:two-component system OmpR family response regulator/two-component system response regulator CpxR
MPKVLFIDDDTELSALLSEYLCAEGFQTFCFNDAQAGLNFLGNDPVDIVVLDVMMPRMNGIEALQRIRRVSDIPVVMLTARGDEVDRIAGLNLGADDYLPKPCSPGELVARLRAILRRTASRASEAQATDILRVGHLALSPSSRSAEWRGAPLDLTGAEFSLLEVLARSAGQIVAKQELSKQAFGRPLTPFDRRIDVHISSVRQKLGRRPDGQSWILAVRGQGYQLLKDNVTP